MLAVALVVVMAGVSLLAYAVFGSDNTPTAGDAATGKHRAATAEFVRQPAVRYTGQIKTSVVSSTVVDLTVTQDGTTHGTFVENGTTIALLAIGGKTFYRAPAAYWAADDIAPKRAARWAKQWVSVLPSRLGVDPRTELAPAAIIGGLRRGDVTMQVTPAQPYRIVHLQSTKLDLDVSYLPKDDGPALFRRLDAQVALFAQAIDSQVEPGVTGAIMLSPCDQRSCTARASIDALSTLTSRISKPTTADIAVDFTVDGRPLGMCAQTVTVPPGGKISTACTVRYRLPADGRDHAIEAVFLGTARALSASEVAKMRAELSR